MSGIIGAAFLICAALPALAAALGVVGSGWVPSSDHATEIIRILDVGGGHSPVVGSWSRWGWSHPGPALFWALAPFERLGGDTGVLVGTGALNALSATAIAVVAWRRGGLAFAAPTVAVVAALASGAGASTLVDPWNPTVAFMPFVLSVFLVWTALCDDAFLLPWAAVAGSFAVQCHVGYAPMVVGLIAVACLVLVVRGIRRRSAGVAAGKVNVWRRAAASGGLVLLLLLWLPPVVQQLTQREGNLAALLEYSSDPPEDPAGLGQAVGIWGAQMRVAGPWVTGDDPTADGEPTAPWPEAAVLTMLVAAAAFYVRRRLPAVAMAGIVTLLATALSVVATSRITGFPLSYLMRWWAAVPAMAMLTLVWSVSSRSQILRVGTIVISGVAAGALSFSTVANGARVPFPAVSDALARVAEPVSEELRRDERYLVRSISVATLNAPATGLLLALERRGFDVRMDATDLNASAVGEWRTSAVRDVDAILYAADLRDLEAGWEPPPGSTLLAEWDPLTPRQRRRLRQLQTEIRDRLAIDRGTIVDIRSDDLLTEASRAGVSDADLDELHELAEFADGLAVFLAPPA